MPKDFLSVFSSDNARKIFQHIELTSTPIVQAKAKRGVTSIIHLRNLDHVHQPMYKAAETAWLQDFLDVCSAHDRVGLPAMIADFARTDLQGFSFKENGEQIAQGLGLDQLVSQWQVPAEKYARFWPFIDEGMLKVFARPNIGSQFHLEDWVKRVFSTIEDRGIHPDWEYSSPFGWKVFFSCAAIGLATISGVGLPFAIAGVMAGSIGMGYQIP